MLHALRGEQKLVVTYYGEARSEAGESTAVYHVVADACVPLEEFAHVVGSPRDTEAERERSATLNREMAGQLAGLEIDRVDKILRQGGLDPDATRASMARRDAAIAAVRAH